ncbi:MAG TPA: hypothetical protein VG738_19535 [Chitinophagaceae bacterium]|nr:hypothetical protein [Chitinophagaceae bacterium]
MILKTLSILSYSNTFFMLTYSAYELQGAGAVYAMLLLKGVRQRQQGSAGSGLGSCGGSGGDGKEKDLDEVGGCRVRGCEGVGGGRSQSSFLFRRCYHPKVVALATDSVL